MRAFFWALSLGTLLFAACQPASEKNTDTAPPLPAAPQSNLGATGTRQLATLLERYYSLKDAFVKSDSAGAASQAQAMAEALMPLQDSAAALPDAARRHADSLQTFLTGLSNAAGSRLELQRTAFEGVSDHLTALLKTAGWKDGRTYRQYCPMAFNDKGGYWLSNSTEIRNPYFGDMMLECGEVTDSL